MTAQDSRPATPLHDGARDGLVAAYILDGEGRGRSVGWAAVRDWRPEQGTLWVHLDRSQENGARWLRRDSGLGSAVCDALLADETRPRVDEFDGGLLLVLRGANYQQGAAPEDLIALRVWSDADRTITVRGRHVRSIDDIREALGSGRGPADSGALVASIVTRLSERFAPVVADLEDAVETLEEQAADSDALDLRRELSVVRRRVVSLRRHAAPQRQVIQRLQAEPVSWLRDADRLRLREAHDQLARYLEDLDEARDRATVTQDEITQRVAEHTNRTIYVLSIVATIFLPLSLVAGMLGMNVGGIPGADSPGGFLAVVVVLAVLAVVEILILRRLRVP